MQAGDRRCPVVYSTRNSPSITASRVPSESSRDVLEEAVLEEDDVLGLEVVGSSLIAELEPEELLAAGLLLELEELEELPELTPLSKETCRVLLVTWLSL